MKPNAHSTLKDAQGFQIRLNTHKLPTANVMTDEAIIALNNARGFSLQKLKKYINDKYQIDMTPKRYRLIKERLRVLMSNGVLINVTGRGLSGCLKLKSKAKLKSAHHTTSGVNEATNMAIGKKTEGKVKKSRAKSDMLITATPVTPTTNQNHQRTVPQAPHRASVAELSHVERAEATPCSSGGERIVRRRQLMPITGSQVF